MAAKSTSKSYAELSDELDELLDKMQADDIDVDVALKLYEQGTELIAQLEARLTTAENKVRELKIDKS